MKVTARTPQLFVILIGLLGGICHARAEGPHLKWGVNGHPFTSYPGVSFEEQLDLVRDLGMTSYRVDVSSLGHVARLEKLLGIAKAREIEILPILLPPVDLAKEDAATLYRHSFNFAAHFVSHFRDDIRVWELGNELENFAIIQPCEMKDDGTQYDCKWGPAAGVDPLDYHGPRWAKVSAVLKGLSDGVISVDPTARKAMGTAGWGHVGAFDRMRSDGIEWDISVWHFYDDNLEWGLEKISKFGKPIWVTEFNHPKGSQGGAVEQARGLKRIMEALRELKDMYRVEAAHVYELLDETYWLPSFEAHMGLVGLERGQKDNWQTAGGKPAYCTVRSLLRGDRSAQQETPADADKLTIPNRSCDLCLYSGHDAPPANKIAYAYCLILGRDADGGGLESWIAELKKGRDVRDLVASIVQSDEFKERYKVSELSNADYIRLTYRLLLNRDPDGQGYNDYLAALDEDRISRHDLAKALIYSNEFRANHSVFSSDSPGVSLN